LLPPSLIGGKLSLGRIRQTAGGQRREVVVDLHKQVAAEAGEKREIKGFSPPTSAF